MTPQATTAILFGTATAVPWGKRPACCCRTGFSLSCPNAPNPARGYPVPSRRTFVVALLAILFGTVVVQLDRLEM